MWKHKGMSLEQTFPRVYRLDSPRGGSRASLWSNFFITYIGWTSYVETLGDVSGATFFVAYIGKTGHLEAVG
jgi:hypothetical protein